MQAFDHLAVLVSIVLGLGITQLLSGFGRWLEQRDAVRAHAPSILWAVFLLLAHIQTWWSMFGLRHFEDWSFLQFALLLSQPIVLYLLAHLVFPLSAPGLDLRGNFERQRPWFFGALLVLLAVSVLKDLLRHGHLPETANLVFHGVLFLVGTLALLTRRDAHQRWIAWIALAAMAAYIALLFRQLG
jgi:hypothetical protein